MQPSRLPAGLPDPDEKTLGHSARTAAHIASRIDAEGGRISFGEYMHLALYSPGFGYYVAGNRKFGPGGDFVTAPEVSPLFGHVLARQCAETLAAISGGCILELGAGSGALAEQILTKLAALDALPHRYLILDASPELVERQRSRLAHALPEVADRVEWLDAMPEGFDGVIIANEVADALPVERFRVAPSGIEQAYVTSDPEGFEIMWMPATESVSEIVGSLGIELEAGYQSEVCPPLKPWIASVLAGLDNGLFLVFDYGLARREYYAPDRSGGWLRCHFRHRAHSDPFILPGVQDITAWVDFTAIAEAASDSRAAVAGYVTQAMFLLHGGLHNELSDVAAMSLTDQSELSRQIKLLTLPDEMGEHFKCMGLSRGDVVVPDALTAADRAGML